eukprot:SAG11_NODE_4291_length_1967_cov_1.268201_1_plen_115_part_00
MASSPPAMRTDEAEHHLRKNVPWRATVERAGLNLASALDVTLDSWLGQHNSKFDAAISGAHGACDRAHVFVVNRSKSALALLSCLYTAADLPFRGACMCMACWMGWGMQGLSCR